ncbi:MAG: hypothetical protein DYG96_10015 [Chlorobi bacterium CHB2]|nr:hypothetical protein [Chlorobi bacterium CHB2]
MKKAILYLLGVFVVLSAVYFVVSYNKEREIEKSKLNKYGIIINARVTDISHKAAKSYGIEFAYEYKNKIYYKSTLESKNPFEINSVIKIKILPDDPNVYEVVDPLLLP